MLTKLSDIQQGSHLLQRPQLLIMSSDTPATAAVTTNIANPSSKLTNNAAILNDQADGRSQNNAAQDENTKEDGAGPTKGRFYHQREARDAWLLAKAIYENAAAEELAKWGPPEQRCMLLGIFAYQTMEIANISRVVGSAAYFPLLVE